MSRPQWANRRAHASFAAAAIRRRAPLIPRSPAMMLRSAPQPTGTAVTFACETRRSGREAARARSRWPWRWASPRRWPPRPTPSPPIRCTRPNARVVRVVTISLDALGDADRRGDRQRLRGRARPGRHQPAHGAGRGAGGRDRDLRHSRARRRRPVAARLVKQTWVDADLALLSRARPVLARHDHRPGPARQGGDRPRTGLSGRHRRGAQPAADRDPAPAGALRDVRLDRPVLLRSRRAAGGSTPSSTPRRSTPATPAAR